MTFEADSERQRREHNDRAWLAYTTAALSRSSKKVTLERLQVKASAKRPGKRQTWQEQMAIMDRMVEATKYLAPPEQH